jgi:DNA-directed RNA polymerase subunit K/omega
MTESKESSVQDEKTFFEELQDDNEENAIDVELSSDEDDDNDINNIYEYIENDILCKYHPEIKQINHLELESKTKIQRVDNIIKDNDHTTIPIMTRYEKAKILGLRSSQINSGADVFIEVPPGIIDGITIANMELEAKKIPFIIRRPLPNGKSEYWNIQDLEILD